MARPRLMRNQRIDPSTQTSIYDWSNRILIASIAGILFLTLYPFRFTGMANLRPASAPFLLGEGGKTGRFADFLNILLFIPFGFGLSASLRRRGKAMKTIFFLTLFGGALLAYGIEFIQLYIPPRDSGWEDVYTNTIGSLVGCIAFALCGKAAIRVLSGGESALESWLAPWRTLTVLLVYFGIWLAVSVLLQRETRLTNWEPETRLLVGNEASGRLAYAWKGTVSRLQLWDQALPDGVARQLTAGGLPEQARKRLLGSFEFAGMPPYRDQKQFLPALSWTAKAPSPDSNAVILDGDSWLVSGQPVADLVRDIQKTNQFSIRVVCAPADGEGSNGRIVSISQAPGLVNLNLRQENSNLLFWFRNPLSIRRSILTWSIPDVFKAGQSRDILFSYDGSDLSLFIDGAKEPPIYRLGPGTGLARLIRLVRPSELEGYNYIYLILVFLPQGILLGIAARRLNLRNPATSSLLAAAFLLPPLVLELILSRVSGRPVSSGYIALSVCIAIAGSLWINVHPRAFVRNN
jgi:glycopeptide antibiotics resistance protein